MTEIKFRAWDKDKKSLSQVELIDYPEWLVCCEDGSTERNSFKNERTDRHVLMQFTGLKDKHGIPIYEGDIINCTSMHDWNIPEWWHEDNSAKSVVIDDIRDIPYELFNPDYENCFEIIGNIYDNPELDGEPE